MRPALIKAVSRLFGRGGGGGAEDARRYRRSDSTAGPAAVSRFTKAMVAAKNDTERAVGYLDDAEDCCVLLRVRWWRRPTCAGKCCCLPRRGLSPLETLSFPISAPVPEIGLCQELQPQLRHRHHQRQFRRRPQLHGRARPASRRAARRDPQQLYMTLAKEECDPRAVVEPRSRLAVDKIASLMKAGSARRRACSLQGGLARRSNKYVASADHVAQHRSPPSSTVAMPNSSTAPCRSARRCGRRPQIAGTIAEPAAALQRRASEAWCSGRRNARRSTGRVRRSPRLMRC